MPTACSSSALVIYHPYRSRKEGSTGPTNSSSKVGVEWWTVEASACILVAAKVNEVPRKVRDIVNVAYQVRNICMRVCICCEISCTLC